MKEVMNTWRRDPRKWMKQDNLLIWQNMWGDQAHNFLKSRFRAMKFQLLGNQALVDFTIRCNLCSAVQPVTLQDFMKRWKTYTQTPDFRKAQEDSRPRPFGVPRRSQKRWQLRGQIRQGKWIDDWIRNHGGSLWRLDDSQRWIHEAYCSRALHTELADVEGTPKPMAFRGAASNIMHRSGVCQ